MVENWLLIVLVVYFSVRDVELFFFPPKSEKLLVFLILPHFPR